MDLILKNRGNYKNLLTFKKATVIYDLTYLFCSKYISKADRTYDQMVQAARSGKQNIAEGVAASSTNAETEIRLINVAKASLKELLTDFEDYLRTRHLTRWDEKGKEVTWLREFAKGHEDSGPYLAIAEKRNDEVLANMTIALLKQEDYLLFRQLKSLEEQLQTGGDFHSRVARTKKEMKIAQRKADYKAAYALAKKKCPQCGERMDEKYEGSGINLKSFWVCPKCGNQMPVDILEKQLLDMEMRRRVWQLKEIWGR